MRVDTTKLMYGVFQICRVVEVRSGTALVQLAETLEIVKQQRNIVIRVTKTWVQQNKLQQSVVPCWTRLKPDTKISPANQELCDLVCLGTGELQRLLASEAFEAVQMLGYAFHIVPRLLRTPSEFQPTWFFRNMRPNWEEYSIEMRQAICKMMHISLEEAAISVRSTRSSSEQNDVTQ